MADTEFEQAFQRAQALQLQGDFIEAEQAYLHLATPGARRETVLRAMVELFLQTRQVLKAVDTLVELTYEVPDKIFYYARLAGLLAGFGRLDDAISHYKRLLERQPAHAGAWFNIALLYKQGKRFADAEKAYINAIQHGIDNVQEIWSNLGVLYSEMHDREKAQQMFQRSLDIDPVYIPALFNLAGLCEESGERERAVKLYEQSLSIDPRHWDSLTRLANATRFTHNESALLDSLRRAITETQKEPLAQEGLFFALGKALDDLGHYEEAFAAYRNANALAKPRNPPYDKSIVEHSVGRMIELFSPEWIQRMQGPAPERPIFICGMFRSGSTLIEQVLASHPSITAGGELDYLPLLTAERLPPFPEGVINAGRERLQALGREYLYRLQTQFPGAQSITDKRPDNFLFLGLIKALFPGARIIYTKRNPVDNCLSIYFQQLGGNLGYSTDLEETAHYYKQHERLMTHWTNALGENIFTVDYDEFVNTPEPIARQLLDFLGLEWSDQCLAFQANENLVKSASLWQVREQLHTRSSGRRTNYARFLGEVEALLK